MSANPPSLPSSELSSPAPVGLARVLVAEGLSTALLLMVVVGSGIMAERLCAGNVGLALLCNALATGAGLIALILTFGPVSGAHMNPVVSVAEAAVGARPWSEVPGRIGAQILGGALGVLLAHGMFELPAVTLSTHARSGLAQGLSEVIATFGLLATIFGVSRRNPAASSSFVGAFAVGAYITSAYWFTASTSFANPAVTLARALTDTFAGILPGDVPLFIGAQVLGAALAVGVFGWLVPPKEG